MLDLYGRIDDKQTEIGGYEFIAAAAGVQFPAERPEFFNESFFDEVMHVLGFGAKCFQPCGIGLCARCNFVERRERLLHFCRRENADGLQGFGPGAVDSNLVRQEAPIERKRTLERVELSIWLTLETSSPQPVVFAFGHWSSSQSSVISRQLSRARIVHGMVAAHFHNLPSALALGRTVTGSANKLIKPSASLGL